MRDVPDFLSHLRRDRRGLPIPYINRWGLVDDVDHVSIAYDRNVGMAAVFYDDAAELVPDFTRQNMQRQRQCMVEGLCQVCATPVPWSRRFLVLAGLSIETIRLGHQQVPVVFEPWLDEQCATFALKYCPALIRRTRDEKLTLVPVTSKTHVKQVVSTGWVEGPLEAESRAIQPAMWVKLALTKVKITTAA